MRPTRQFLFALLATLVPVAAGAASYSITIENMVPGGPATGQPLTPPVVIVHDGGYSLFSLGSPATAGLEKLAEDGVTADLIAEANGSASVHAVEMGGGPFFGSETVMVEANPGDLLSIATMLARTNDIFTGVRDVVLPNEGVSVVMTNAYDAGTEMNTGLVAHIPFYGNSMVGPDEGGNVSMIDMYTVMDDPDHGMLTWNFPPTAVVTIVVNNPAPVEPATWAGVKNLYR